ncbi:hypothetical protein Pla22_39000 [Rubripirellula amarantea]|uniref:Sialate O-acetylesterase domain-containing protein n=1 Tax=Rubripirellula amarantea TaxID=2527999 RepID=A0A5C5WM92_9BACT|nr:sialate O-acetylesterase [Rubripirellula amarantea]TWT51123.1 hypothetical protein Pla22_39000 [Rubripirellula amarantea]
MLRFHTDLLAASRMAMHLSIALFGLSSSVLFHSTCQAEVRMPSVFGDHMVLQQQKPIHVWGWADANETVKVSLGQNSVTAEPDANGRWEAELPAMKASHDAATLVIEGDNRIEFQDVLVGEVWLCSGQSNMEWTVSSSDDAANEIASAKHPLIRHIKVPHVQSMVPLDDFEGSWQVCSPTTVGSFTAAGYFMARELLNELDVPVGLINSSWGGTRIEPWTPVAGFESEKSLHGILNSVLGRTAGTPQYESTLKKHVDATEAWLREAKSRTSNVPVKTSPEFPKSLKPFEQHQDPTMLFNAMIHPILGIAMRGAIWYQGESNLSDGAIYTDKMKALIGGWRQLWGQGDFPFYFVQIAPYRYGDLDPSRLPEFWEAQQEATAIANTGMVVVNDIAMLDDIHPTNKQDVGKRLALLALKNDYGKGVIAENPTMESMEIQGNTIRIRFANTGLGLKTRDGKPATHFEMIGSSSGGFQPANVTIQGDSVLLNSEKVQNPTAFRYSWHKLAEPNLTGSTGLPVGAMRGGDLPSFFKTVPHNDDYQLVYELDLSKLSANIEYNIDNSDEVKSFDRIGYYLQLGTSDSEADELFVTMDAFTDDVQKIGIPTISSGAHFQQPIVSMDVFSTSGKVTVGTGIETGNIEFWPNNYGPGNSAGVAKASSSDYDFGDQPSPPTDGYGCMQVHNTKAGQTIFAVNQWKAGAGADIGIGNSEGKTKDWTFNSNASSYKTKRMRIYVRPTK